MFEYCPAIAEQVKIALGDESLSISLQDRLQWFSCYFTTKKHLSIFRAAGVVMLILAFTVPVSLFLGFLGALGKASRWPVISQICALYVIMVRGIPDIIFFLFVPLAIEIGIELFLHKVVYCRDVVEPFFNGVNLQPCGEAAIIPTQFNRIVLAIVAYGIVFGSFAANIIDGGLKAVPFGQRETGAAFGLSRFQVFWDIHLPQMWRFALPGFSNLWLILIKATPLLFLLGIQDIIYYADLLGKMATRRYSTYPHGDWKLWYFIALGIFYLLLTMASPRVFAPLEQRFNTGMSINNASSGGV